jgi:hypothetical protein
VGVGLCGGKMMNSEKVVPPLAANMSAAFKKVRGASGASDPVPTDLIVTRIVELAKDGVYDIEELSSRTPYGFAAPTCRAGWHHAAGRAV